MSIPLCTATAADYDDEDDDEDDEDEESDEFESEDEDRDIEMYDSKTDEGFGLKSLIEEDNKSSQVLHKSM